MKRRSFLRSVAGAGALGGVLPSWMPERRDRTGAREIDRRALVGRHKPVVRRADPFATLSVGNGRFAFTADVTGLQSFPDAYNDLPLATQAEWGWHTFPNPERHRLEDAREEYDAYGQLVPYLSGQATPAGQWFRQSPHRLSLARVGLSLRRQDGGPVVIGDLHDIEQRLDLWNGLIASRFGIEDRRMRVLTCVHPSRDVLAVDIDARAFEARQVAVRVTFPYGSPTHTGDPADWTQPERHSTEFLRTGSRDVEWLRVLDADRYYVRAAWLGGGSVVQESAHVFRLQPSPESGRLSFVIGFSPERVDGPLPDYDDVARASAEHWQRFWSTGGAIDLSASTDPRAPELERRVVLSQYITAIQCAGTMPPQETGLTFNSWHGKSHLEMHWWHGVHFALWDRIDLLERSLPWYASIQARARETARVQGYEGVRWPKMVGPDGRESPSTIGVFLIWQQPHPIYFAELVYRARPERATLLAYSDIVSETATFMASYPYQDNATNRYVLGPPLIPAQESHPPRTTRNPTFELAYWRFGLATAQRWRERLGQPRNPTWDRVLQFLSPLPMRDGLYVNAESAPHTFTDRNQRRDHPTLLGAFGFVPPDGVDRNAMRRTLMRVMSDWQWEETWGWDYPLVAMTAARIGEPGAAMDALLMDTPKNRYLPNGHNYQREGLTIYLPGNGGLLAAVAMMAAGWDGSDGPETSGFPKVGWRVAWENLRRMP